MSLTASAFVAFAPDPAGAAPVNGPIGMTLAANPTSLPEPGGTFNFTLQLTNSDDDPVLVSGLTSSSVGSLAGKGTCAASIQVPGSGSASCTYSSSITGNVGTVTETVTGQHDGGDEIEIDELFTVTASTQVRITDVLPSWIMSKDDRGQTVPEPEGTVTYYVNVRNLGPEPLTITAVQDIIVSAGNRPIDITKEEDVVYRTTCGSIIGTVVQPGGVYECNFTIPFRGNAGDVKIDDLSVTVRDDEGNSSTRVDSELTEMTDVKPTITVDKSDNNASLPAHGGNVVYSLSVTNTSVEDVVIKSITDTLGSTNVNVTAVGGIVVATNCNSLINQTLAKGASATCSFTLAVTGTPGTNVRDTITVSAMDNDNNTATASDSEDTPIGAAPPVQSVPTTTVVQPTTTVAPANETVSVLAAVATPVSGSPQLALTGADSAKRAAVATMLLGAGLILLSVEIGARRRNADNNA